eukprot:6454762-Amphidinium_carterae.1
MKHLDLDAKSCTCHPVADSMAQAHRRDTQTSPWRDLAKRPGAPFPPLPHLLTSGYFGIVADLYEHCLGALGAMLQTS